MPFEPQPTIWKFPRPPEANQESDEPADPVNHPSHYNSHPSGIEVIEITQHMDFLLGNVVKYVLRCDHKGGIEDLKKARWYIDRAISLREQRETQEEQPGKCKTNKPAW